MCRPINSELSSSLAELYESSSGQSATVTAVRQREEVGAHLWSGGYWLSLCAKRLMRLTDCSLELIWTFVNELNRFWNRCSCCVNSHESPFKVPLGVSSSVSVWTVPDTHILLGYVPALTLTRQPFRCVNSQSQWPCLNKATSHFDVC